MVFNPAAFRFGPRAIVTHTTWNALIAAITTHLNNLSGADLAAPLVLSKTGQDLDGDGHYIYNFKRWLGTGGNVAVRDVCGFGATGDGTTDDSPAIRAAIEDLPKAGGVVLFPPGTYVVGSTVQLTGENAQYNPLSTTVFMGFGRASIIKAAAAMTDQYVIEVGNGTENMAIVNMQIDGSSVTNVDGGGIDMNRSVRTAVINCWIEDCNFGIAVGGAMNSVIYGTRFMNNATYDIVSRSTQGPGDGLIIDACQFYNAGDNSIDLTPGPNHTVIANSHFELPTGSAIRLGGRNDVSMEDVIVSGNTISATGANGIEIRNLSKGVKLSGIVVSNNQIRTPGADGIIVEQISNSEVNGVSIHGNAVLEADDSGIRVTGCRLMSINDNILLRCGQDSASTRRYGISLGGEADNEAQYITVTGNTCADDEDPVSQQYGINLSADTKNCVVVANSLYNNAIAGIRDLGEDNDIGHNAGQP